MPIEPSVKGAVFGRAVEDTLKFISANTVGRGELKRWLQPTDIALLDQPSDPEQLVQRSGLWAIA